MVEGLDSVTGQSTRTQPIFLSRLHDEALMRMRSIILPDDPSMHALSGNTLSAGCEKKYTHTGIVCQKCKIIAFTCSREGLA